MQYSTPSARRRSRVVSSVAGSYCGVGTARLYSPGRPLGDRHGTMDEIGEAAPPGRSRCSRSGRRSSTALTWPPGPTRCSPTTSRRAAAERTGDVVLPALPYGCSLGHTDHWPGTLSLHPATMIAVVVGGGPVDPRLGIPQARDRERPRHQRAALPERDPPAAPRAARPAPALRLDLRHHAGDRRALHGGRARLPRERGGDLDGPAPGGGPGAAGARPSTSPTGPSGGCCPIPCRP